MVLSRQLHVCLINGKQRWWCVIALEVHPQLFCFTATELEMILFTLLKSYRLPPSLHYCNLSSQSCQKISLMCAVNKKSDRTDSRCITWCPLEGPTICSIMVWWTSRTQSELLFQQIRSDSNIGTKDVKEPKNNVNMKRPFYWDCNPPQRLEPVSKIAQGSYFHEVL